MRTMLNKYLIIDFDSTFVTVESLDELSKIALESHPEKEKIVAEIAAITKLGMEGKIGFTDSLQKRLQLFSCNQEHIKKLVELLNKKITDSFLKNKKFIKENADNIYIVSGGFKEFITPIVSDFGITEDRILANEFLITDDQVKGCNPDICLSKTGGKIKAVQQLKLEGEVFVIGDGFTDYQIKQSGIAHKFLAFTENVKRDDVIKEADLVAKSFDDVINALQEKKVLLLESINGEAKQILESNGFSVELVPTALSEEDLIKKLKGVSVLGIRSRTEITEKVLKNSPDLKIIGAFCIGLNQIDLEACQKFGVKVFNAPFSNTRSVAELVIGEIIMLSRKVFEKSLNAHKGIWDKSANDCFEIRGKTLGIVGYGNIGSQVSVLAELLGMKVQFFDIEDKQALGNAKKCNSLEEVLSNSDFITLHIDGRKENKNLISEKEFNLMKDGVIFLNLSRGFVVNNIDLAAAVKSGKVLGCAVDVFEIEPEKNGEGFNSPLQNLPNVILTPHIGGSTVEAQKDIGRYVAEKIINEISKSKL